MSIRIIAHFLKYRYRSHLLPLKLNCTLKLLPLQGVDELSSLSLWLINYFPGTGLCLTDASGFSSFRNRCLYSVVPFFFSFRLLFLWFSLSYWHSVKFLLNLHFFNSKVSSLLFELSCQLLATFPFSLQLLLKLVDKLFLLAKCLT